MSPTTIGSMPDLKNATQAATPTRKNAGPFRTPRARSSRLTAMNASPATSGITSMSALYATAMTTRPTRSSTTEKVSR